MSKKREFDKPSHSGTGRTDVNKKGGHGTWGSNKELMDQGKTEFAANKGPNAGGGNKNASGDPENLRDLNQMGNADTVEEEKVSFEAYQKQKSKPYTVSTKKTKKRNPKKRTQAQKTTDFLFNGEASNNRFKNKNKNKKGAPASINKNKGNNKQIDNKKSKNRKAKEVLMTSVSYDAPDSGRGRGRGRGGGRGRGYRGGGYRGGYQGGYGGGSSGGWRGRGGGFGSRGRGRKMEVNNTLNGNHPNPNPPSRGGGGGGGGGGGYRKVDQGRGNPSGPSS